MVDPLSSICEYCSAQSAQCFWNIAEIFSFLSSTFRLAPSPSSPAGFHFLSLGLVLDSLLNLEMCFSPFMFPLSFYFFQSHTLLFPCSLSLSLSLQIPISTSSFIEFSFICEGSDFFFFFSIAVISPSLSLSLSLNTRI